ncbi:MAG: hypothetical protein HQK55_18805 [Deltaproteobacteria bacterium]|nr:hypothetical protein [Deltaproteobacteria bacterium]
MAATPACTRFYSYKLTIGWKSLSGNDLSSQKAGIEATSLSQSSQADGAATGSFKVGAAKLRACATPAPLSPAYENKVPTIDTIGRKASWSASCLLKGKIVRIRSILFGIFLLSIAITAHAYTKTQPVDDPASILQISDTTFSYSKEDGNIITTIGTIKNLSNMRIGEVVFEVKYFDQAKKLIDTVTQSPYQVVVPPSQEVSFRVRDTADKPMDSYVSSTVRVVSAEQRCDPGSTSKKNSFYWIETSVSWLPMLLLLGFFGFLI